MPRFFFFFLGGGEGDVTAFVSDDYREYVTFDSNFQFLQMPIVTRVLLPKNQKVDIGKPPESTEQRHKSSFLSVLSSLYFRFIYRVNCPFVKNEKKKGETENNALFDYVKRVIGCST